MAESDIARILIPESRLKARVAELAEEISERYEEREVTAVGVLTGAFVFLADLGRRLRIPLEFAFLRVSSYTGAKSSRRPVLEWVGRPRLAGKDVLVVEDIVDTGHSLRAVLRRLEREEPASLSSVALLDKKCRRDPGLSVAADFTGFEVPDEFLVGYGLDYSGRYRNLPYVGVLDPAVYAGEQ